MDQAFEKYKGIHPGAILDRELKKRNLSQRPFALSLEEHPQTLHAISKGKRGMNTGLALKIEKALGLEEGTLMILQVYYEIAQEKLKANNMDRPDLSILRPGLFWDTDIQKIDWRRQYKAVIRRVFERGDEHEKKEIIRFYGKETVEAVTGLSRADQRLPLHSSIH